MGSTPGLGRCPGGGNGNLFHYSHLKNPWTEEHGRLQSTELQSQTWLSDWTYTQKLISMWCCRLVLWARWVLCSGSYKAVSKVSAELSSYLEALGKNLLPTFWQNSALVVQQRSQLPCRLSAGATDIPCYVASSIFKKKRRKLTAFKVLTSALQMIASGSYHRINWLGAF